MRSENWGGLDGRGRPATSSAEIEIMAKARHWKQRFDPHAPMVWRKKLKYLGKELQPGDPCPGLLSKDNPQGIAANKLRMLWESRFISLADWEAPSSDQERKKREAAQRKADAEARSELMPERAERLCAELEEAEAAAEKEAAEAEAAAEVARKEAEEAAQRAERLRAELQEEEDEKPMSDENQSPDPADPAPDPAPEPKSENGGFPENDGFPPGEPDGFPESKDKTEPAADAEGSEKPSE